MNPVRNLRLSLIVFASIFTACESNEEPVIRETGKSGYIYTFAGVKSGNNDYTGDGGIATSATFGWVTSVAVDAESNVYISDGAANTIRKVNASDGIINTIAGKFRGYNNTSTDPIGENVAATTARLELPTSVTVDVQGNIIISEAANHRIRKVSTAGVITTSAGNGNYDYPGDHMTGISVGIWNPFGVTVDADRNIYYADSQNNAVRMISHVDEKVTTIAGLGPDESGYTGDNGAATAARLNMPQGLAFDSEGGLYIADGGNHVIRKITNGVITTYAGTGTSGYTGDGGPATSAKFNAIRGIAFDGDDNLFIAEAGNNVIRKISADGIVSTFAGNGKSAYTGDYGPATEASISSPMGVAVDKDGNVYIADSNNIVVRIVFK